MNNLRMGIDQSYNQCAWVIINDDTNSLLDFGVIRSNKDGEVWDRALEVALQLVEVYGRYYPSVVKMEGLAFGTSGNVTRDLAGLLFTIINVFKLKHPVVSMILVPPTAVKKVATGSGKAKKPEMIAALPKDIHDVFVNNNYKKTTGLSDLADAYWISRC